MVETMAVGLSRDEYNKRVMDMQEFCYAAGLEYRFRVEDNDQGEITARFEVFWDQWVELGLEQNALTPQARRTYWEFDDARIRYHVAGELLK